MSRPRLDSLYPTAFVTGASAGLGQAFCEMLLAEGVRVWGTARSPERLSTLAQQHGFTPVLLDLGDRIGAEVAFTEAAREANTAYHTRATPTAGFALVINNAGYGVFADALTAPAELWEQQIGEMLLTTLRLGRAALRGMQARGGGCLVNVSSLAVEFPLPYLSGYNVAKAGLSAWSESLDYELADRAVRVIDLRPGDFRTTFNQAVTRGAGVNTAVAGRVWARLEQNLASAPPPVQAAAALRRALAARRSGVVRTGSFFQARLAPLLVRCVPDTWRRKAQRVFFDL